MDVTTVPNQNSFTILMDGAPSVPWTRHWVNPQLLYLEGTYIPGKPTVVTLSYAGGDPGLRIAAGPIVEAFDLGAIPECP